MKNARKRRFRRIRRGHYADLTSYMKGTGDTQAHIATEVKTSQAAISRIANGLSLPRADLASRLVAYARIPYDSFLRVYLARQRPKRRRAAA